MSDSIEKIAEDLDRANARLKPTDLREYVEKVSARLRSLASLRQVPEDEPVAWTIVGPDGKSSIGGWSDMSNHRVMSEIGVLRDGHRYAYAYEANPARPTSCQLSGSSTMFDITEEATPAQAGAELEVQDVYGATVVRSEAPAVAELSELLKNRAAAAIEHNPGPTPAEEVPAQELEQIERDRAELDGLDD